MQHKSERVNFGSKLGAILAAAGSAVGLGNIWRFPYETGNHGGAAFYIDLSGLCHCIRTAYNDCGIYYWSACQGVYGWSV